jgi:hypothetical protein
VLSIANHRLLSSDSGLSDQQAIRQLPAYSVEKVGLILWRMRFYHSGIEVLAELIVRF